MSNAYKLNEEVKLKVVARNYKDNEEINVKLTFLDENKKELGIKEDVSYVKDYKAIYPFIIENVAKEKGINPDNIAYVKGWMDADGDGKIDYGEEVWLEVLNKYIIIGIHSNALAGDESNFSDGHAWISIRNLNTEKYHTYGLWTDKGESFGLSGTKGEGIKLDEEIKRNYISQYQEYREITKKEYERFLLYVNKEDEWVPTHTCADWARDGYKIATGIELNVDDWLGLETPRELSKTIKERQK